MYGGEDEIKNQQWVGGESRLVEGRIKMRKHNVEKDWAALREKENLELMDIRTKQRRRR